MCLINIQAYQNARKERKKVIDSLPFEISSDSATENAGRAGFNLQEIAQDINGINPEEIYEDKLFPESKDVSEAMEALNELSDFFKDRKEEVFADFTDLLIKKIAQETSKDYLEKFNNLILKINNTDIPETNDAIKKLTKIFSRTILLELSKHNDLSKAQESAYKKVLHRADQYLSEDRMIAKRADIYQNPKVVARYIKNIIDVLVSRFSTDAKLRSYPNLRNKIQKLNPYELSAKKSPGGAAIGVAITLIKNILNGRDPHFINLVISNLVRIL